MAYCKAPDCGICGKNHHQLICPEEEREQQTHKIDEDENQDDEDDQQEYPEDQYLFAEDLTFNFAKSNLTDDGDTFEEYDASDFEPTEEDNMYWSEMEDEEYEEYEDRSSNDESEEEYIRCNEETTWVTFNPANSI